MKKQLFYCGQPNFSGNYSQSNYTNLLERFQSFSCEDNVINVYFIDSFSKNRVYYFDFGISLEENPHVPINNSDLRKEKIEVTIFNTRDENNGTYQEVYKGYINSNTKNIHFTFSPLDDMVYNAISIKLIDSNNFLQPNIITEIVNLNPPEEDEEEENTESEEDITEEIESLDDDGDDVETPEEEEESTTEEEIVEDSFITIEYFNNFIIKSTPFEKENEDGILEYLDINNYSFNVLGQDIDFNNYDFKILEINNLIDNLAYNVNIIANQESMFVLNNDMIVIGPNKQFKLDTNITFIGVIDGRILSENDYYSIDYDEKED